MENERPKQRAIEISHWDEVMPNMTNPHGTMFGGKVLEIMDNICAIAAMRYCRKQVVTISSEHVDFKVPIRAGTLLQIKAKVVRTGTTSMAVKVRLFSQHPAEENAHLCTTGFFNFVALDRTGKNTSVVPELIVETDEEKADWEHANKLHQFRLQQMTE